MGGGEGGGQGKTADSLIMDDLKTSLAKLVNRYHYNSIVSILDIFIQHRSSEIFVHPAYYIYGPGLLIAVLGSHKCFLQCF